MCLRPSSGDLVSCELFFFQAEDGIRDLIVTGVQTCALPIYEFAESIVLADLTINQSPRKVLLHAPKNGFFYVLDRATGELISAKPYTAVSWAKIGRASCRERV